MRWVYLFVCVACLASALRVRGIVPTNTDDAVLYPLVAIVLLVFALIFGVLFLSKQWASNAEDGKRTPRQ
jgi:uncharacterized membrane protein YtjA (UPF0391 family)